MKNIISISEELCEFHDYDFYQYKGEQRIDKIARNLVDYEAGNTIFKYAVASLNSTAVCQNDLFKVQSEHLTQQTLE